MTDIMLRGVAKRFGRHAVLDRVDLDIGDGEFCVFVGPSGCGKSTLLRIVAGLEEVSSGEIHIGGRRVTELPPAKRGVAMVFQSYALYPHMTAFENMAFGLSLRKHGRADIDRRVRDAAALLHIEGLLDRKPRDLSGGQRQRVAIGRAIVREPDVFLFDEPLSNLDAALRVQTRIEIARLHASLHASMIYVTHDQIEAMTLADKIVLLNAGPAVERDGSVAQIGAPMELYHHPDNIFVASFIGSPKMNLLTGKITSASRERAEVALPDGTRVVACVDAHLANAGDRATLGIRPEHVLIHDGQDAVTNPAGCITLQASHVEHVGGASFLYLEGAALGCSGSEALLTVREDGETRTRSGDRLTLILPKEHCHLFGADGRAFPRVPHQTELARTPDFATR